MGASGLVLLLITGELAPGNVLGFCVAASNAFGLIAGAARCADSQAPFDVSARGIDMRPRHTVSSQSGRWHGPDGVTVAPRPQVSPSMHQNRM